MGKKAILLINIGSPRSYQVADVKAYLKLFLMDKWIIDIAYPLRWILVNLLILPKRSPFSAQNYKKVWMPGGSPLIVYSEAFRSQLQTELGDDYLVRTGMCFSEPNIEQALLDLQKGKVESILAIPMFPQYAGATTGSVIDALQKRIKKHSIKIPVKILPPFFNQPAFVKNSARVAMDYLKGLKVDHYVFSFHGLPEKQVLGHGCKMNIGCSPFDGTCVKNCYRSQCLENARLQANEMNISSDQYTVAFQSRLGRAKWIGPSTDETLKDLAEKGIKDIAVFCPSFVADCIETIEEIGMGATEDFIHRGGKNLHLVPCLNDDKAWARDFAALCLTQT